MNNLHPLFKSIIQQHVPALVETLPIQYRGYTIEEDKEWRDYQSGPAQLIIYPTDQGIQHDYDYDGDGYRYCGNSEWADCIDEAKYKVDELLKQ
jgi:hypothetical protein